MKKKLTEKQIISDLKDRVEKAEKAFREDPTWKTGMRLEVAKDKEWYVIHWWLMEASAMGMDGMPFAIRMDELTKALRTEESEQLRKEVKEARGF